MMCKVFRIQSLFLVFAVFSIVTAAVTPFTLKTSRSVETVIRFEIPKYSLQDVLINNEKCILVQSSDAAVFDKIGMPELPYYTTNIAIGSDDAVVVSAVNIKRRVIAIGKVIPSRGVIVRDEDPSQIPYAFSQAYTNNTNYPLEDVSISSPFIFRDIRGVTVVVNPFQYNGATKELSVIESMTIRVVENGRSDVNVLKPTNTISLTFSKLYKKTFLNYSAIKTRYTKVPDGEKMIVITPLRYVSDIADFVRWKRQKGIATEVYCYPKETGGTGTMSLKAFIKNKYDEEKITYVLLVGEAEDVPSISVPGVASNDKGLSDPYYTKVSGTDNYPDIFIGRFCVNNSATLANIITKTIKYEKEPENGGEWYGKAVGHGSNEAEEGVKDYQWIDGMRTTLIDYGYSSVDKVYQGVSGSLSSIVAALNEGRSWYSYIGHGLTKSFGYSGATVTSSTFTTSMTSEYKNPVLIAVACNVGKFNSTRDCIAEFATKASKSGTVAFFGSTIKQPWVPPIHALVEMVKVLTDESCLSLGSIVCSGCMKMMEKYNNSQAFTTFDTWILFGDPSLMVYSKPPTTVNATFPSTISGGFNNFVVDFGEPLDGRISLYDSISGVVFSAMLDGDDRKTISFMTPSNVESLKFTISARNRMPFFDDITVDTGPYIAIISPIGGEKIQTLANFNITWADNFDENVKIELLKGNVVTNTIVSSTESDGGYAWNVPASIAEGTDYRIAITSVTNSAMSDTSVAGITIGADVADQYILTVASGSGDGRHPEQSNVTITAKVTDKMFDKWVGYVSVIKDVYAKQTTLTMPGRDITVTATYSSEPNSVIASKIAPRKLGVTALQSGQVKISIPTDGIYTIKTFSVVGKQLSAVAKKFDVGDHLISANVSSFSSGLLIVTIDGVNSYLVEKLVFQKNGCSNLQ